MALRQRQAPTDEAFESLAAGLPLRRFRAFDTSSPEEVERNVLHRHVVDARLLDVPAKGFRVAANRVTLGRIGLHAMVSRGFAAWAPGGSGYIVSLHDPRQPMGFMQCDGACPIVLDRGGAIGDVSCPGRLHVADLVPRLSLGIPGETVRQRVEALLARPVRAAPVIDLAFDASREPGASFARAIRFLVAELDRNPAVAEAPLALSGWEDLIIGQMLASFPHEYTERLARPVVDTAPWQVRRAEEWLTANATEQITMTDLAAAVDVSLRTLQHTFQRSRGYSPRTFLRYCRLDLARSRLRAARPGTTVTEVAFECGFLHLGSFARDYRQRFGESPSATLRRA